MDTHERASDVRTVLIVGAGFCGALTAIHLLKASGGALRVILVERTGVFGPGVAYSTSDDQHRLNAPAERLSAFESRPDHFKAWAEKRLGPQPVAPYLGRAAYGSYIKEMLDEAMREAAHKRSVELVTGDVVRVDMGDRAHVRLRDGRVLRASHIVLAVGPLASEPPVALPDHPAIVQDPWTRRDERVPVRGGTTVLIGSGLTAVDMVLSTITEDPTARLVAVSRSGRVPCAHLPGLRTPAPAPEDLPTYPATAAGLERWFHTHAARMRGGRFDWRDVVDGVRPVTTRLWQALPLWEQQLLLERYSRRWDLCRHRMGPEAANRVRDLQRRGQLQVAAASVVAVDVRRQRARLTLAAGATGWCTLTADRVVLCTGPGRDVHRNAPPVVRDLLARGVASADAHGLGLRATPSGAVIAPDGKVRDRLYVLGALRRGELWESTAVAELRAQAAIVAAAINEDATR